MTGPGLAELCIVACAQAWRGDGAILASPMGLIPSLGARLAQLTFSPQLLVTDGEAMLIAPGGPQHGGTQDGGTQDCTEGWLPYRDVLRLVATGRRHMMMGAAQIDRYGNQNISCIGDWARPKAQLLGVRGAPGNTINHPVSYWIPRHSPRVFVDHVDMVSGIGYDRAAALTGRGAAFHQLRVVVSDKAVLDFATAGHSMRLRSVHPGVSVAQVQQLTGFDLVVPDEVPQTPLPTAIQLALIRDRLDPGGLRDRELA
jgi:acyl CoA:acetate/3-ketoacid CoA transferase beta subunit